MKLVQTILFSVMVSACSTDEPKVSTYPVAKPEPHTPEPSNGDTASPVDDTGSPPDDTASPDSAWTVGPELPECTPIALDTPLVALSGVLLTPTGPIAGEVVYHRETGEIVCTGESCDDLEASRICTEGTLGEQYESMLVRVSAVSVTDSNPDSPDDYGEFEVDGCLRVDDQLSEVLVPQPTVGTDYSALSGVLTYT